jgi:flagellar export protein FliJ
MKRFLFPLDTVLRLRRHREDELKQELGRKNRECALAARQLEECEQAVRDLDKNEESHRQDACEVQQLRAFLSFRYKLKSDIRTTTSQLSQLHVEAAQIRDLLIKAQQQVRAVELLREHAHTQWHKEYTTKNQQFIDDISQQGFIRRTRAQQAVHQ